MSGLPARAAGAPRVVAVVGNPRPASRTHAAAATLRDELAAALAPPGEAVTDLVDLAGIGAALLDRESSARAAAIATATSADVLVVASPTYKATYTGLLKLLFDAFGPAALAGTAAVPLMIGAGPGHALAVDVHLTPLLLEVGAAVPVRGLYVLEAELPAFAQRAHAFAEASAPRLRRAIAAAVR